MEISDGEKFLGVMNAVSEYYGKPLLSDMVIEMYFNGLTAYSIEQVKHAISKHMADTTNGQYMPKVSDLIRHIEGGQITPDQILGAARLANTPMGILCRIQIGTWDLEHQTDMFYLRQRAEECLLQMPEWKQRALTGDYTDHELSIMIKHNVNPCDCFYQGLPPPMNSKRLLSKISEIKETPRHKFLMDGSQSYEDMSGREQYALEKIPTEVADVLDKIINED